MGNWSGFIKIQYRFRSLEWKVKQNIKKVIIDDK